MATGLNAVEHIVVLMLENRSLDHVLGWLYADSGNISPTGQPFEGLTPSPPPTPAALAAQPSHLLQVTAGLLAEEQHRPADELAQLVTGDDYERWIDEHA